MITKTRCAALDGKTWIKPGAQSELVTTLRDWLDAGDRAAPAVVPDAPVDQGAASLDNADAHRQIMREILSAQKTLAWTNEEMGVFAQATCGKPARDASLIELETLAAALAVQIEVAEKARFA